MGYLDLYLGKVSVVAVEFVTVDNLCDNQFRYGYIFTHYILHKLHTLNITILRWTYLHTYSLKNVNEFTRWIIVIFAHTCTKGLL